MRRHWLAIALGTLLATFGCRSDPVPVSSPTSTTSAPTSRPPRDNDATRAMRPFLGRWRVDVDGTALASRGVADEVLGEFLINVQQHPFTLDITRNRYVSVSDVKTVIDQYEPLGYEDSGAVVISLRSLNGAESDAHARHARLLLRDGQLLIGRDAGMIVVMTRIGR